MTIPKPPANLPAAAKREFDQIAEELMKLGIDPAERRDLLVDFVQIGSRIAALRAKENSSGPASLATSRAVTTATSERRRLRELLFRRPPKPAAPAADPAVVAADEAEQRLIDWLNGAAVGSGMEVLFAVRDGSLAELWARVREMMIERWARDPDEFADQIDALTRYKILTAADRGRLRLDA